jgi:hypothetical protein
VMFLCSLPYSFISCFFFLLTSLVPVSPTTLCRVLCPCESGKCKIVLIPDDGRKAETYVKIIVHKAPIHIIVLTEPDNKNCLTNNMKLRHNIFNRCG